jgi:L-ribulose-5-phosphate 4-epimerase
VKELKEKLLVIARAAEAAGLAHESSGNFSVCHHETGMVVITPSVVSRQTCSPDDMCVVDLEGNRMGGLHKPSSETPMHTMIYRGIPSIKAIAHTHSVYATAFAVAGKEIKPYAIEILKFNGRIPLVPYAIPGSSELGANVIAYLKEYPVVLLENHGLLATGKDLDQALLRAIIAEDLAKVGILAHSLGGPQVLTDSQVADIRAFKKTMQDKSTGEIVI